MRNAPLALLLLLAACGQDTARTLGFTRDAPDEFAVVTRAPLSMPPALGDLPTPRPGAPRPQELTARDAAQSALVPATILGGNAPQGGPRTRGEEALLARAGNAPAMPDVRRRVDEEALRLEQTPRTFTDRLLLREQPTPGIAVDPQREAQRLRENAALGTDPGDGTTPIIQPQGRNVFQRLFGG
jgi:pyruvate/2-oxoglutarate dehydrogenase complex dihydrolipoamide acyltransferase (E2) component